MYSYCHVYVYCYVCSVVYILLSLRLTQLRFFGAFSSVVKQMPGYTSQRRGTVRTLSNELTFRHRASCFIGQAFRYSPENAFYIFNEQIYFIIRYLLDRASLI